MGNIKKNILIVDADRNFKTLLSNFFEKRKWTVHTAIDGQQAFYSVQKDDPDIILMDIELPVRDGILTCYLIKHDITMAKYYPIIMMGTSPGKNQIVKSIEAGCDDFVIKPFKFELLIKKIEKLIEFYDKKIKMEEREGTDYQKEEEEAEIIIYSRRVIKKAFLNAMSGKTIDYPVFQKVVGDMVKILHKENNLPIAFKMKSYNDYIYIHSINVATLSLSFAYHLKWDNSDIQTVGEGGFLHDIGKTKIDLQILMKPEKLTDQEFSVMKKHTLLAKDIMAKQEIQDDVLRVILEHHERVDGQGYPNHLDNKQISKYAKLVGIVDSYDALTTDRCFQSAVESEEAVKIMSESTGQFDQELFKKFTSLIHGEIIGK